MIITQIHNYFLDLMEINNKTSLGIAQAIIQCCNDNGISMDILRNNLIGFASDGASAMRGETSRAVVHLKQLKGTEFTSFHCMAHRLDLAIHYVLKHINTVSHFQILCQEIHYIYAFSSKHLTELQVCTSELSTQILKIAKVFDVRWLMSTYNAVNALWCDLASLQQHMLRRQKFIQQRACKVFRPLP